MEISHDQITWGTLAQNLCGIEIIKSVNRENVFQQKLNFPELKRENIFHKNFFQEKCRSLR